MVDWNDVIYHINPFYWTGTPLDAVPVLDKICVGYIIRACFQLELYPSPFDVLPYWIKYSSYFINYIDSKNIKQEGY